MGGGGETWRRTAAEENIDEGFFLRIKMERDTKSQSHKQDLRKEREKIHSRFSENRTKSIRDEKLRGMVGAHTERV